MNILTKYEAKYLEKKKKEKKPKENLERCKELEGKRERWNPDLRDLDAKDIRKKIEFARLVIISKH